MPRYLVLMLAVFALGRADSGSAQPGEVPCWRDAFALPPAPGNEAWYADADSGELRFRLSVTDAGDGTVVLALTEPGGATPSWRTLAEFGADGDVSVLADAEGDGPLIRFAQPLPIVDAPLYVGKSWSVGWSDGCLDNGPGPLHAWGVTAEAEIVAPAGQYHCYCVSYRNICDLAPSDQYWYAEGVGLVKMVLLSGGFGPTPAQTYVLAAGPVPGATITWGAVKAGYR